MFDLRLELREAMDSSAPVVLVDVPHPEMLERVLASWQDTLFPETARVMKVGASNSGKRDDYDVVYIAVKEPPKTKDKSQRNDEALSALSLALPLIAISPAAETHLPEALLKSRPIRLSFPGLDPVTIARAIRIVTGKRCRELLDRESTARITPVDLVLAVRFDRTPGECMAELRRLAGEDLEEICLLALGSTGADVERITNDALRFARHAERPLELADLRRALVHQEDRTPCEIWRAAIHEAGHLLTEIVLFAYEADVQATIARSKERGGATVRTKVPPFAGTYSGYQHRLQVLLAGRTAEEIVLGAASHGAGGRRGSDLQQATAHAAAMVGSLGIGGTEQLLFLASHDDTDELLSYVDVRLAARAELIRAAEACHSLLLEHRTALEEIAATLLRAGRIDGVSAADIIHTHRNIEEPP
jgi:Peptidase family M41